jgi:2-methylisocitrate lyase-like PEP mutase family enzyme
MSLKADLGIATQDIFIDTLFTLTSIAGDTPVIADADTGFGSTLNIARTVQMYERAGAAALHLEDQVMYVKPSQRRIYLYPFILLLYSQLKVSSV